MPRFVFKKEKDLDNRFDNTNVTHELEAETLEELAEAFTYFVRACGYQNDIVATFEEEETARGE